MVALSLFVSTLSLSPTSFGSSKVANQPVAKGRRFWAPDLGSGPLLKGLATIHRFLYLYPKLLGKMKRLVLKPRFHAGQVSRVFPNSRLVMSQRIANTTAAPVIPRPYRNNSIIELVNSYSVFSMCGIQPLVKSVPSLVKLSKTTKTDPLFFFVVKNTFFRHFCGGETLEEVVPRMQQLSAKNVGSILDLAIEADLGEKQLGTLEIEAMVKSLQQCIDIASKVSDSFIAVKVTALAPSSLLLNWSNTVRKLVSTIKLVVQQGETTIGLDQFLLFKNTFPGLSTLDLPILFEKYSTGGRMSQAQLLEMFSISNIPNCRALTNNLGGDTATASDLDMAEFVLVQINKLASYAKDKKVKLMMDAEQSYFQPAIDDFILSLARNVNPRIGSLEPTVPVVYNTYQMYLKDSLERLQNDVLHAQSSGYSFGVKLVRGAYMVSERERAKSMGYTSPIHDTIEDTHTSYNAGVQFIIEQQSKLPRTNDSPASLSMVVASHNHESAAIARGLMEKNGIPRSNGWVAFAQLLGMQDGLTENIASKGYRALKYVPYGPVPSVIAYLHRRAQENSQMVAAMKADKSEILKELRLRILG